MTARKLTDRQRKALREATAVASTKYSLGGSERRKSSVKPVSLAPVNFGQAKEAKSCTA